MPRYIRAKGKIGQIHLEMFYHLFKKALYHLGKSVLPLFLSHSRTTCTYAKHLFK